MFLFMFCADQVGSAASSYTSVLEVFFSNSGQVADYNFCGIPCFTSTCPGNYAPVTTSFQVLIIFSFHSMLYKFCSWWSINNV